MGDAAEMVLDGTLDWDGSYSGNDYGYSYNKPMVNLTTCMQYLKQMGFKTAKREKVFSAYQAVLNQPSWNKTANLIRIDKASWKAFKTWASENSRDTVKAVTGGKGK